MTVLDQHPSPLPTLPVGALEDIAGGLARVTRRVEAGPGSDPAAPRSSLLIAGSGYDVWLVTWPPDSELGDHDHGDSTCVTRVVSGSLLESIDTCYWVASPGTSVVTPPQTRHRLWNASTQEATTLHVYSPPLTAVNYHPGARPGGRSMTRSGGAEATSPARQRR